MEHSLSGMSSINPSNDALEIVEQINRLAKTSHFIKEKQIESAATVLIVEDNPVNLLMVQNILKQTGLHILSATDGKQAVNIFKDNNINLILMDCQMPIMDGFVATKQIRRIEVTRATRIPVIALTANAFTENRQSCIAAGMDDFLSKPFKKAQLLDLVERWLSNTQSEPKQVEKSEVEQMTVSHHAMQNALDVTIMQELKDMDDTGSNAFIAQITDTYFANAEQLMQKLSRLLRKALLLPLQKCASIKIE